MKLSKITKEAKAELKSNKKENTQMSKNKTIILTVLTTLAILGTIATIFYYGAQYGISQERSFNNRLQSEAKSLTVNVAPVSLK